MFWSINRSHQSDIGGSTHGAYNPGATEIWQEGIRITPLKLYDAGEVRDDVMKMIATNVRHPDDFLGDLRAMIGSARVGERRVLQLLDEYGPQDGHGGGGRDPRQRRARRRARASARGRTACSAARPSWTTTGTAITDIHIRATVTVKGDALTIDLTDSHPQVHGFINSSFPNMMSAVYMALAFLIDPRTPEELRHVPPGQRDRQAGHDRVAVPARPGDARHQSLRAGDRGVHHQGPREVLPRPRHRGVGRGASASPSRASIRARSGSSSGTSSTRGRGGGASPVGDGWETAGEGQAAGGIKFGSIEVAEARFPLFFEHHEFRPDSFGDGQYRGGAGSVLRLKMETKEPGVANTAGDGVRHPSYGTLGGQDGQPHRYRLLSKGKERYLKTKEVGIPVMPGDVFFVESAGGGGYGPPAKRLGERARLRRRQRLRDRQARAAGQAARGEALAREGLSRVPHRHRHRRHVHRLRRRGRRGTGRHRQVRLDASDPSDGLLEGLTVLAGELGIDRATLLARDGAHRPRHDRGHQRAARAQGRQRGAPDHRGASRRDRDARGPQGRSLQRAHGAARCRWCRARAASA